MASNSSLPSFCLCILLFFSLALTSSAHHISNEALKVHGDQGRRLSSSGQSNCPVDFSKVDYSPLLKKCKGPHYKAKPCCDGLKKVSCPYCDDINKTEDNTCAYDMFFYITEKGNYPIGLFTDICRPLEDKGGNLPCE